jgi:molybdopterin biosynthesis enzyme
VVMNFARLDGKPHAALSALSAAAALTCRVCCSPPLARALAAAGAWRRRAPQRAAVPSPAPQRQGRGHRRRHRPALPLRVPYASARCPAPAPVGDVLP